MPAAPDARHVFDANLAGFEQDGERANPGAESPLSAHHAQGTAIFWSASSSALTTFGGSGA